MLEASRSGTAFRDYVIALPSNEKELSHAGGGERGKHGKLFHKIKCGHYNGQRLAPAIG